MNKPSVAKNMLTSLCFSISFVFPERTVRGKEGTQANDATEKVDSTCGCSFRKPKCT